MQSLQTTWGLNGDAGIHQHNEIRTPFGNARKSPAAIPGADPLCFSSSGSTFECFLQSLTFLPLHGFIFWGKATFKFPTLKANLPKWHFPKELSSE